MLKKKIMMFLDKGKKIILYSIAHKQILYDSISSHSKL